MPATADSGPLYVRVNGSDSAPIGFEVLPGNDELTAAEVKLINEYGRETRLRAALARIDEGEFGYCEDCGEEIAPKRLDLDPTDDRVLKELALFAERCCITEELTRLDAHLGRFREFLGTRYHKPSDATGLPFHDETASRFTAMNVHLVKLIANDPQRPTWNDGDFFGELFAPSGEAR